ncbi:MAG TPA: hypothetical protein VHW60_16200 [Caulobacteraceae bacterium]|jgi:hypothetical protein|nr:hypothetical protein [Caulobacteraceae bacterium]
MKSSARGPTPYAYRICGLRVASEIDLPGAIPVAGHGAVPEVSVRLARLPARLDDAAETGPNWSLAGDRLLLHVPRLARYLITGGHSVDVELTPGATVHDASAFVLGTAFGILLHQRGALVLHGAAVARAGSAIALCGRSGAGKSTLAAALCQAGCEFVTDDLCAVEFDAARQPLVEPDGRQLKLWRESMEALDLVARQGAAVRGGFEKYFFEPKAIARDPPRLAAIYVLRESRPPRLDGIEALATPDAMRMLDLEAYRPGLRARLGSMPEILAQGVAMLRHTKVFRLVCPRSFDELDATVARLSQHWEQFAR